MKINPMNLKNTDKTVIVRCVDGTEFYAPAKGKVMVSDYIPSDKEIDDLLTTNLFLMNPETEVIVEDGITCPRERHMAAEDKDAELRAIHKDNMKYYASLPKFWHYDRKGNLKTNSSN